MLLVVLTSEHGTYRTSPRHRHSSIVVIVFAARRRKKHAGLLIQSLLYSIQAPGGSSGLAWLGFRDSLCHE